MGRGSGLVELSSFWEKIKIAIGFQNKDLSFKVGAGRAVLILTKIKITIIIIISKITKITLIISFWKDKDDKNCDGEEHKVNNRQPM